MSQRFERPAQKSFMVDQCVSVPSSYPNITHAFGYLIRQGFSERVDISLNVTDPQNTDDPGWVFVVQGKNSERALELLRQWDGR
jgi:hypothetical protein